MINAGKYFSKLVVPFVLLFLPNGSTKVDAEYFYVWCFFEFIATMYCMLWDYYMDWGLWRCFKKGKWGLRDKISYDPKFYYFAIMTNCFLRFFWLFTIWHITYDEYPNLEKQL